MSNLETILIVILWIISLLFCHKRKWYAEFDNNNIYCSNDYIYTYITNLCYMNWINL
jgi:hypothetical protein